MGAFRERWELQQSRAAKATVGQVSRVVKEMELGASARAITVLSLVLAQRPVLRLLCSVPLLASFQAMHMSSVSSSTTITHAVPLQPPSVPPF